MNQLIQRIKALDRQRQALDTLIQNGAHETGFRIDLNVGVLQPGKAPHLSTHLSVNVEAVTAALQKALVASRAFNVSALRREAKDIEAFLAGEPDPVTSRPTAP